MSLVLRQQDEEEVDEVFRKSLDGDWTLRIWSSPAMQRENETESKFFVHAHLLELDLRWTSWYAGNCWFFAEGGWKFFIENVAVFYFDENTEQKVVLQRDYSVLLPFSTMRADRVRQVLDQMLIPPLASLVIKYLDQCASVSPLYSGSSNHLIMS